MQKILFASGNPGKLREITAILADRPVEIVPASAYALGEPAETGLTFVENALLKARHAARLSGLPAIGDDSGLEVDALGGAPGVWSARYAGEHADDAANNAKLLQELRAIPEVQRSARFRCVMVYLRHERDPSPDRPGDLGRADPPVAPGTGDSATIRCSSCRSGAAPQPS